MPRILLTFLLCSLLNTAFSQEDPNIWAGGGEYPNGEVMSTVMKKMASAKNIVLQITPSGEITGTLNITYDKTKAQISSEAAEQTFLIAGHYEPSANSLLLIVTHIKGTKSSSGDRAFIKPDSIYYSVVIEKEKEKIIMKGIADVRRNRNTNNEWIGSADGYSMGMNINDMVDMHLLPLRIRLEKFVLPPLEPEPETPKQVNSTLPPISVQVPLRKTEIQRIIVLDTSFIKIDMYDNGEIDGDIATLILDGKVIMDSKLLSTTAATISLDLSKDKTEHIIELFANNLGSIPPNTALLVLTCNRKRYEINLSSNGTANGSVKLVFKPR